MLYQSGYLTIKGYDKRYREYLLDFPNDEVKNGFMTLMAESYFGKIEDTADSWVKKMDRMLRRADLESVREALAQIDEMQYAVPYMNDARTIHKIGVKISSKSRTVDEWMVE